MSVTDPPIRSSTLSAGLFTPVRRSWPAPARTWRATPGSIGRSTSTSTGGLGVPATTGGARRDHGHRSSDPSGSRYDSSAIPALRSSPGVRWWAIAARSVSAVATTSAGATHGDVGDDLGDPHPTCAAEIAPSATAAVVAGSVGGRVCPVIDVNDAILAARRHRLPASPRPSASLWPTSRSDG